VVTGSELIEQLHAEVESLQQHIQNKDELIRVFEEQTQQLSGFGNDRSAFFDVGSAVY